MSDELRNLFQGALQEHGYGFESAVASKLRQLNENGVSRWSMLGGEFPVSVRGQSTRIDIVLSAPGYDGLAVCECKRANPALSRWCFVRQPHVGAEGHDSGIHVDAVRRTSGSKVFVKRALKGEVSNFAHLGLPVRAGEQGDARGHARDVIEHALTQVARGTNGLIQFLSGHDHLIPLDREISLYQIIFTTASLWLSEARLSRTDLLSGNVSLAEYGFESVDWVMYQYPQSPALRADVPVSSEAKTLFDARNDQYYRSVFIVSAAGIEEFMKELR